MAQSFKEKACIEALNIQQDKKKSLVAITKAICLLEISLEEDSLSSDELAELRVKIQEYEAEQGRLLEGLTDMPKSPYAVAIPKGCLDQVVGNTIIKEFLYWTMRGAIDEPNHNNLVQENPPKKFLLYGVPGIGKTLLVNALAANFGYSVVHVNSGSVKDMYVGQSEQRLIQAFDIAINSRRAILFMDEVEAITPKRGSKKAESSTEIDPAIIRRFDARLLVKTLTLPETEALFAKKLKRHGLSNLEIKDLARRAVGLPTSDILQAMYSAANTNRILWLKKRGGTRELTHAEILKELLDRVNTASRVYQSRLMHFHAEQREPKTLEY